jgi:hypothetical protein
LVISTDLTPIPEIESLGRHAYTRQISYPPIPDLYLKGLPKAIRSLAATGKLSIQVVELAHRVAMSTEAIDQIRDRPGGRRPGNHDASNMQELENVASLLGSARPPLTKIERVLCIAISIQVMEGSMAQRQSPVYLNLAMSHAKELLSKRYDSVFEDPDEEICYINSLCILLRPMIESIELSPYVSENDIRARLVRQITARSVRMRDWEDCRSVLRQFYYWDGCELQWQAYLSKASALWEKNAYLDL